MSHHDPYSTLTIYLSGQDVVLSAKDVERIKSIRGGKVPEPGYNLYEDMEPWFSNTVMDVPVRDLPVRDNIAFMVNNQGLFLMNASLFVF